MSNRDAEDRSLPIAVDWLDWGTKAFELATREQKPILLRLTAEWCHWCKVMDRTSDIDAEIAGIIRQSFIPIRVDTDRRPEINIRYNQGGWPTNAFLTPEGDVMTGGTYLPSAQFKELLNQVSQVWQTNRGQVESVIAERKRLIDPDPAAANNLNAPFTSEIVSQIEAIALMAYDNRYGGFGSDLKFLQPGTLALLLEAGTTSDRSDLLNAALHTLRQMAEAGSSEGRNFGIYDHIEGGFFRYSTNRDWSKPSFEKLLEDNARMLDLYVTAYQITAEEVFKNTAYSLLQFFDEGLYDEASGAFHASVDAGGEERYYGASADERADLIPPKSDQTIFVNWNALAVSGHLKAGTVLQEPFVIEAAHRTLEFLRSHCRREDGGMSHYNEQSYQDGPPVLLTDQISMAEALFDAFEESGNRVYLDEAVSMLRYIDDTMSGANGAYRDHQPEARESGLLSVPIYPLAENSAAAQLLWRLAALTDNNEYRERAKDILQHFSAEYERYGLTASAYARAVRQVLREPVVIRIVGSVNDALTQQLHRAALTTFCPGRVVELLDRNRDRERIAHLGYPTEILRAYISQGSTQASSIASAADLARNLAERL